MSSFLRYLTPSSKVSNCVEVCFDFRVKKILLCWVESTMLTGYASMTCAGKQDEWFSKQLETFSASSSSRYPFDTQSCIMVIPQWKDTNLEDCVLKILSRFWNVRGILESLWNSLLGNSIILDPRISLNTSSGYHTESNEYGKYICHGGEILRIFL